MALIITDRCEIITGSGIGFEKEQPAFRFECRVQVFRVQGLFEIRVSSRKFSSPDVKPADRQIGFGTCYRLAFFCGILFCKLNVTV
ncbi:hypothetical protein D3C87_1859230 [compost metagenome]